MARILVISDSFSTMPDAVAVLASSGHHISYVNDLTPWADLTTEDRRALHHADAIVMGRVMNTNAEAFALAPNVRVVALHTSGSDNVDLEEASRRGVLVTNVKGVNAEQCAEYAMGLMLCVTRQILTGDRALRAGLWASQTHTSMDIHGSTVGVIGLGQIAKAFVTRVRSFGTRILVHTRSRDAALAESLGFSYAGKDDLLKQSDIVCLFASLTPETRHMIGAHELSLMKPSAFLVNIARGELIDQDALLAALHSGQIAGAGLDVYEVEPLFTSPLFALENVVLTPHQAGLTRGGKVGAAMRAARNALEVLAGGMPKDAVNPRAAAANIK
jgi:phosphoglycerate dehydrogenase-like enzyme